MKFKTGLLGQFKKPIAPKRWTTGDHRKARLLSGMVTNVDTIYNDLIKSGMDTKSAAKLAQNKTGLSIITGRRMKTRMGM